MTNRFKTPFPIFTKYPDLAYLDNAATSQRPQMVIDSITNFYETGNSNIHRGVYKLSNEATKKYDTTREKVARFLGAPTDACIAFTKGTTESINVVASSFLKAKIQKGENVVTTIMEHHANFIPWQMVAKEKGAEFRVVPIDENGDLNFIALNNLLDNNTRLLAVSHISNTLGTVNDIQRIIEMAHKKNIPVMIDAAQSAAFYDLNQKELDYDFLSFSGHKMFGPFGVGVLFVSEDYIDQMIPYNYGGGMIEDVAVDRSSFRNYPFNLEAGTPNVAGVVGLSSSIDFVNDYNQIEIRSYLSDLILYCDEQLIRIPEVTIVGQPKARSGIISFVVNDIHPHDVASFLNEDQIAVRAGMHCTHPLLTSLNFNSTVRISLSIYNEKSEIDRLIIGVKDIIKFWS